MVFNLIIGGVSKRYFSSASATAVAAAASASIPTSVTAVDGVSKKQFSTAATAAGHRSNQNVGILATDIYFPSRYVSQEKLEAFDGVDKGRYTIGLGQSKMAFAGPEEDINSMCMTALDQLMTKYQISPKDIGFLGVGTETLVDKSKSTKTHLMGFFAESGNTDIEGVTTVNACYGGTASLFHAIDWVESSSWDGRYAIVLAGDIAVYSPGNARSTGGAGVVAMLIGPNAPIVFEQGLRASHFEDVYDFYKPNMDSDYPVVDGQLSNSCYIRSIDRCFQRYANKFERAYPIGQFRIDEHVQHSLFHLPYTKLVQKSFARFAYNELLRDPSKDKSGLREIATKITNEEASYSDKALEKACLQASKKEYETKVFPSTLAGRMLGNMYAGSLYGGLLSLIAAHGNSLLGQRALMFSYGSGLAASMFSLRFEGSVEEQRQKCDLVRRLDARIEATPEEFTETLKRREQSNSLDLSAIENTIAPGTFYLNGIDKLQRREYSKRPAVAIATKVHAT